MTYSLPELVLIGAAQNLVLNQSTLEDKIVRTCLGVWDQDGGNFPSIYNNQPAW